MGTLATLGQASRIVPSASRGGMTPATGDSRWATISRPSTFDRYTVIAFAVGIPIANAMTVYRSNVEGREMVAQRESPVAGVIPPLLAEGTIREAWPSVASVPMVASLGLMLTKTYVLAPVAWVLMSGVFFAKLLPFFMCRYSLTN